MKMTFVATAKLALSYLVSVYVNLYYLFEFKLKFEATSFLRELKLYWHVFYLKSNEVYC